MSRILIVVDMQKDFVDGALGSDEAIAIVDNVVEKIRGFRGKIFVTLDTHEENYLSTLEGKNLPVEHCIKGTDGWKLNSAVEKALEGKDFEFVEKPTFGSVNLVELLREYVDSDAEIELVGLCTDICVVSNALLLKANYYETPIYVDAGACAGVSPEAHNAAISTMKSCHINIINE